MRKSTFCKLWRLYTTISGVILIALVLTVLVLEYSGGDENDPVIVVQKAELLTPSVKVGGSFSVRLWRKSLESCPGTVVISFTSVTSENSDANIVISARYPYSTAGYNSPPPLVITRELPAAVGPGKWLVRNGVESRCPTRTRFDQTSEFILEVTP